MAEITLILTIMLAAAPYVAKIRHSSQTFLAAYLIFALVFLAAFFALFNGFSYLLHSWGQENLLEQAVPLGGLLFTTFLLSLALASWQARKPHVSRKPQ